MKKHPEVLFASRIGKLLEKPSWISDNSTETSRIEAAQRIASRRALEFLLARWVDDVIQGVARQALRSFASTAKLGASAPLLLFGFDNAILTDVGCAQASH